ncbi:MAG: phosphatidate cytidylyltransferase [Flavobacteriales bacterium]|jgi:phosphatidate cytidylyltransferase
MSDVLVRALTGLVFLLVMISGVVFNSTSCFWLFLVIVIIGNWEYSGLQEKVSEFKKAIGVVLSILLFTAFSLEGFQLADLALVGVIMFTSFCILSVLLPKERLHLSDWAHVIFSQVYVTMPFVMLYLLSFISGYYEYKVVLSFFILLWLSDTGAYLFGKYFGRHKLLPKVSPKKTWEGLVGGVLSALIGAYFLLKFGFEIPGLSWYVLALLVSILGAMGDLFESQMKRNKGVKDSGSFMPGHGGILDRFDGVLLSVPVIFAIVKIMS